EGVHGRGDVQRRAWTGLRHRCTARPARKRLLLPPAHPKLAQSGGLSAGIARILGGLQSGGAEAAANIPDVRLLRSWVSECDRTILACAAGVDLRDAYPREGEHTDSVRQSRHEVWLAE